jgi:hypothetical protein
LALDAEIKEKQAQMRHLIMVAQLAGELRDVAVVVEKSTLNRQA